MQPEQKMQHLIKTIQYLINRFIYLFVYFYLFM